jgi:hypothetical protein
MTDRNTLVLQGCTDAPRVEHDLCSERNVQSSDDSDESMSIKIEDEEMRIKEEVEPIAIPFSSIKDEPEVSPQTFLCCLRLPSVIMLYCLYAFGEWKWSVCVCIYSVFHDFRA